MGGEATLKLLDGQPITYTAASNKNEDFIKQLACADATRELYRKLRDDESTIRAVATHHLGLGRHDKCVIAPSSEWLRGSFNICIPIAVKSARLDGKVVLRCPMPHKCAEAEYPGTVDEKLGCEVGTYAWMQENCPDVRIPHLYGFGFSDHRHFTHEAHRPFYIRIACLFRRFLHGLFRSPSLLSRYTANPTSHRLPTAYMLLEHIGPDTGEMLSKTWNKQREDPARRQRLFRGLARLMLSLARVPQPRIGSFRFHDDGSITLTNRPLACSAMVLENQGAPRTIQQDDTYSCTDSFVADMLTLHDNSFLSNRHAVIDDEDCRAQMAVKAFLRAVSHRYIRRETRDGPFVLQLTDLHASNLFVDQEWNITCVMDLEWVCALPVEMLAVPTWLSGRSIDGLTGVHLAEYATLWQEFMRVFHEEETEHLATARHGLSLEAVIRETWDSRGVWFWLCVDSVNAMLAIPRDHICPRFLDLTRDRENILSKLWSENAEGIVKKKIADEMSYDADLRRLFQERQGLGNNHNAE